MRIEKWNAVKETWERLYDEPVTADGLWDAQAGLQTVSIPGFFFAERTRLSLDRCP